jgi:oligopeptide/dipeptide ABC transporter ATP-binding protein
MTAGPPILEVRDLKTVFLSDRGVAAAVNGVDFTLRPGETLGLVGESGCGKTVTGLSILRLVPDPPGRIVGGEIRFDGTDLLGLEEAAMQRIRGNRIAMIFQEPMTSLNPIFTVGYQIAEAVRRHRNLSRTAAREQAVEMLDSVGIPDPQRRVREYPHQMSGGMRQRAMIAMALSCDPQILIADEPTTALDVTIQAQILELIDQLKARTGTSVLFVTHDLGVIAQIADTVAVMYTGRIVEYGSGDALFDHPRHPYTRGLMASVPKIHEPVPTDKLLPSIAGVVPSLFDLPAGCTFRERCPQAFERCSDDPPLFEPDPGHRVRCFLYES